MLGMISRKIFNIFWSPLVGGRSYENSVSLCFFPNHWIEGLIFKTWTKA